ncbi:MAG: hypothetical protein JRG95_21355 [Deltaproteobacteria bacterium]|nr:hypothetical protein [Deltaproteobacteria bacterium]
MERLDPNDVASRPSADLALKFIEARFPRTGWNEIIVEVSNAGRTDFNRVAWVAVKVNEGDICHWPNNATLSVPDLRQGEARQLIFRGDRSGCGDGRLTRPRSEIRVTATMLRSSLPGEQYTDPVRSNDSARAWLGDILRAPGADQPVAARSVQLRLSNLVFKLAGSAGAVSEIKWISLQVAGQPEQKFSHDRLAILAHGRSDDRLSRSDHHLKVRNGDFVGVPNALTARAIVQEGERVEIVLKVRDMDCTGDRNCNRGDTGKTTYAFNVPVTSDNCLGNCDRAQLLGSTDEFIASWRGSPTLKLDVVSGFESFKSMICFMPASGRGGF